jgi:hypothetical protein
MSNIRVSEYVFKEKVVRFPREGTGSSVTDIDSNKISSKQTFH